MKMRSIFLAVTMLLGASTHPAQVNAASVPVAGYIVGLDNESTAYFIRRGNLGVRVRFYVQVVNGDIIEILEPAASLTIQFVDRRVVRVTKSNTPYTVKVGVTSPTIVGNVSDVIWQSVTRAGDAGLRTTGVRGDGDGPGGPLRLALPGLSDGVAVIETGQRKFGVEWRGGAAPYRVTLRDPAGAVVVDETSIEAHRLIVASRFIDFRRGTYSISILDRKGEQARGLFQVTSRILPLRKVKRPKILNGHALTTWSASTLVGMNRKYYYEAYLRIQDAAEHGWQPAVEMRIWLGSGAPRL